MSGMQIAILWTGMAGLCPSSFGKMRRLHVQRFHLQGAPMTLLHQRMCEDMQVRNFSENTQKSYLQQVHSLPATSADPLRVSGLRTSEPTNSI